MSIRDDLADIVDRLTDCDGQISPNLTADAVLAYLGNVDGSADPELIAWHLQNDKAEIERLKAELADEREGGAQLLAKLAEAADRFENLCLALTTLEELIESIHHDANRGYERTTTDEP